jgi:hypothetical protein
MGASIFLGHATSAAGLLNTLNIILRALHWLSIFGSRVEILRSLYRWRVPDLAGR